MSKCKSWLKNSQKRIPKWTKMQTREEGLTPKNACRHFSSVDWHKLGPRLESTWIRLKHIIFYFLEIRTRPSSYSDHLANFSNTTASINRGWISKFSTLFHALRFPLFSDSLLYYFLSYVKDILEALALRISFL